MRRLQAAAVAIALTTSTVVLGLGGAAGASVQPGTITCTAVTGTMTFTPPITTHSKTVKIAIHLTMTTCSTTAAARGRSAIPAAAGDGIGGVSVGLKKKPGGTLCQGTAPSPGSNLWRVKWKKLNADPTDVTFSGEQRIADSGGHVGFTFPGAGGTASGTGSYAGGDGGASSAVAFFSNTPVAQFQSECATSGVSQLSITNGGAFFG